MRKERLMSRVAERLALQPFGTHNVKSLDIVGDIAILKVAEPLEKDRFQLAQTVLDEAPSVKVVYRQIGPVSGDYRLKGLEWLAGERRSSTIYREYGCQMEVDVEKDYFSPRLAYERTRISKQVCVFEARSRVGEIIINMFAGVGSFSLRIAKETKFSKIYSIDINSDAFLRMFRNVLANNMLNRIMCAYGDAVQIIHDLLRGKADRVLMPLPEKWLQYLTPALEALKPNGGLIHIQTFVHAKKNVDPVNASSAQVREAFQDLNCESVIENERIVRSVGPRWYQVAHDVKVTRKADTL